MSSLKSGALLSLFSGFSFEGALRASRKREPMSFDMYPSPSEIAHSARFSAPAQATATKVAALDAAAKADARLPDAA